MGGEITRGFVLKLGQMFHNAGVGTRTFKECGPRPWSVFVALTKSPGAALRLISKNSAACRDIFRFALDGAIERMGRKKITLCLGIGLAPAAMRLKSLNEVSNH